jgi:bla regulator protein blaR1
MLLFETLKDVLLYLLESAACLSVFYLFYYFFLRKENCFNYNRFYLLAAVTFSVVFPLIHVSYNPISVPEVLNNIHEASNEVFIDENTPWKYTISALNERPFFFWWEALAFVYGMATILLGIKLFIQIRTVRDFIWTRRNSIRFNNHYFLVNTDGFMPTFAFFNYLFWDNNQQLSEAETKQIIAHEEVHIKQRHSFDIMLMEVLKVVFWFNPLMYLYKSTFEEVHEYEADYGAVKQGNKTAYTQLLVKMVFKKMGFNLGSHFAKNKTLKRVDRIVGAKKTNALKLLLPIPMVALLFFIFSCDSVEINHKVEIKGIAYQAGFESGDTRPSPKDGFPIWIENITDVMEWSTNKEQYPMNGTVTVMFDINTLGKIKNIQILESLKEEYDEIVIKALEDSNKWDDWDVAYKNGRKTTTKVKMPIKFKAT